MKAPSPPIPHPIPHPILEGQSVHLRPTIPEDADIFFAALSDKESMRLTGTQESYSLEDVRSHYQRIQNDNNRVDYSIILPDKDTPENPTVVGEVVLHNIDWLNKNADFRIALVSAAEFGKGYGTEATRLLVQYGFEVLELHRIALEVYDFNPRAQHVYEKCGFVTEGVRRQVLLWEGIYYDAILMAILKDDYVTRQSQRE